MNYAHYSDPERDTAPLRPVTPAARDWITAKLAELRGQLATVPDGTAKPLVSCPACGSAISLRQSRHGPRFIATHPPGACAESQSLWHLDSATQEAAIAKLEELLTV